MPHGLGQTRYLVCQECGRGVLWDDEQVRWWLVADRTDGMGEVIRCPQHISIWTLRVSGLGRGKDVMEWVEQARENDPHPPSFPMAEPYPFDA